MSSKEETVATWTSWLLDAIHKIRFQKQRPNIDRLASCVRMHHPQYSNEAVQEHLDMCIEQGTIIKMVNKGLVSYRDPESSPKGQQRILRVNSDTDLTRVFVRSLRELGDLAAGATLKTIERQVKANFVVEMTESGLDFCDVLRTASKRALSKNMITTDDGVSFKSISSPLNPTAPPQLNNQKQPKLKQLKLFATPGTAQSDFRSVILGAPGQIFHAPGMFS